MQMVYGTEMPSRLSGTVTLTAEESDDIMMAIKQASSYMQGNRQ